MWQYIITPVLIVIIFLGITWGKTLFKKNQEQYTKIQYAQCFADGKLEREEIKRLLTQLPATADRDLNKMGAMCYKMAGPPERAEYNCPTCGEKTLYVRATDNQESYTAVTTVGWWLESYRRSIKEIKGIYVVLDESQFCKKCSPHVKTPALSLNITLPGETTSHHVTAFSLEDIRLLIEFTHGEIIHKGSQDRESLLKDHQADLERLLGVSSREK